MEELGILTVVRNDDNGTVVTSTNFDLNAETSTTSIDDPKIITGVDKQTFTDIQNIAKFSQPWDPQDSASYMRMFSNRADDHVFTAYPISPMPEKYDPIYRPEFFASFLCPRIKISI